MTREEFDKLYLDKAIHCDTEEKANEFLALAHSVGYRWFSGRSLIEQNLWEMYEEETSYDITEEGVLFDNTNYYNLCGYQIIEYEMQPQPKFKVGDRVRIKDTQCIVNGKVGVIEKVNSLSPLPYTIKIDGNKGDSWLWLLTENDLEKVEEPTYGEETIDDIIEEIKDYQKSINILLNRLERKAKVGK